MWQFSNEHFDSSLKANLVKKSQKAVTVHGGRDQAEIVNYRQNYNSVNWFKSLAHKISGELRKASAVK